MSLYAININKVTGEVCVLDTITRDIAHISLENIKIANIINKKEVWRTIDITKSKKTKTTAVTIVIDPIFNSDDVEFILLHRYRDNVLVTNAYGMLQLVSLRQYLGENEHNRKSNEFIMSKSDVYEEYKQKVDKYNAKLDVTGESNGKLNYFLKCNLLNEDTVYTPNILLNITGIIIGQNVKEVVISNNITGIKDVGFNHGNELVKITFGKRVRYIGRCFVGCYHLKEIRLPEGLQFIERNAFKNCRNLKKIAISHKTLKNYKHSDILAEGIAEYLTDDTNIETEIY